MSPEIQSIRYDERVATVVGGRGQLGSRIVKGLDGLGFREVRVCGEGDPFTDFVRLSTDLFFAVDADQAKDMLQSTRDLLQPQHSILDGSSVKSSLISLYRELDNFGISVCSTHLGAVPTQPWRGIKVWICEVGPNSGRAKRLALDLFIAKNTSIQQIDIEEHENVEQAQWFTFATMHVLAGALRRTGLPLEKFSGFATLNAELASLPLGRTLGQGVDTPSEILFRQPKKVEFLSALKEALTALEATLNDRKKLEKFNGRERIKNLMARNISFHDNPRGVVKSIYDKAGIVGARNANLRMYEFGFRVTDDRPGRLRELLLPFHKEGANLTAIDSMPGEITPEEESRGVDPDRIVDFDIGIDPKTIDNDKAARIKRELSNLGCSINDRQKR